MKSEKQWDMSVSEKQKCNEELESIVKRMWEKSIEREKTHRKKIDEKSEREWQKRQK
jgi:hypothetical protein